MPYLDVYLDRWSGPSADCAPLATQLPHFPDGPRGRVWYAVMARTDDGRFKEWVDVDWGTRVAKVTKAQIIRFIL